MIISYIVPIIVVIIILLQVYFFIKNVKRMNEYKSIFKKEKVNTWRIQKNIETGFISGIEGDGNEVFNSIKRSINVYLSKNSGSVIDFQLLKDSVDRHCDAVENDVTTLTPIPLYCGLAGTMAGIIVGLTSLLLTDAITALLKSGQGDFGAAAIGVNDLLSGVAWAMLASICGIIFTTVGSILFKSRKIQGESGKNDFFAWLQAELLPELPSDTSDALKKMVKGLNKFNNTFASNTQELRGTLQEVNQSYQTQADIIKTIHDMDIMKMARANVKVLTELEQCTDKLEQFNEYLDSVQGYTEAIQNFTELFNSESERLHVLEGIQQFFERNKGEIAKDTADADIELKKALANIKESALSNSAELNKTLTEQSEAFKSIAQREKETFEELCNDLKTTFSAEMSQIPQSAKNLEEISAVPAKIDQLISKMEESNASLVAEMKRVSEQLLAESSKGGADRFSDVGATVSNSSGNGFPDWMKWTIVTSAVLIAVACLTNTVVNAIVPLIK